MTTEALRQRALKLLALRDHSRAELSRKLSSHGSREEIEEVLDRMAELDLQSDRRFAEQFVRSRAARLGLRRLQNELAQRGIDPDLSAEALHQELPGGELERARALWQRRFGTCPADPRERARQARFLEYRGFSADVIGKLLRGIGDEPA